MSSIDSPPTPPEKRPDGAALLKKLAVWALFLLLVYVARDFFFVAFMTFLFSYLTLTAVGWALGRLSPGRERPWLRRLLTVGVFVLVPLALVAVGVVVGPRLLEQGQHLAGWLGQVNPETEVSRLVENVVGPMEFQKAYGGPSDPRYQKGLEEFRATGQKHVAAYNEFPNVEAWMEGGFHAEYAAQEAGRVRARLAREGTSSEAFKKWFLADKLPELQEQARREVPDKGRATAPVPPLVRAAATDKPEQVLALARSDPATLAALRQEWVQDTVEKATRQAGTTAAYREAFRAYYERQQAQTPAASPYTFDEYVALKKARAEGRVAFGDALEKLRPTGEEGAEERLRADFEAARKHELFREWWGTSSVARFIRQQVESTVSGGDGHGERLNKFLTTLLNVPLDLSTALLLSLFICLDFPNLRRAARGLQDTWLRDAYDALVPALPHLGQLTALAMFCQGMIALCNAVLMFVGLTLIGVQHAVLLGFAVFILCLVPTLGVLIAWGLIALFALLQPGGGPLLALKASGVVAVVLCVETFVLSPRIMGRTMELHPVLLLAILPMAQYFFGVWGLILATPVTVYVVHVVILRRGLPGSDRGHEPPPAAREGPAAGEQAPAGDGRAQEAAAAS
jgi:predicted PurR-regulated permease PerM